MKISSKISIASKTGLSKKPESPKMETENITSKTSLHQFNYLDQIDRISDPEFESLIVRETFMNSFKPYRFFTKSTSSDVLKKDPFHKALIPDIKTTICFPVNLNDYKTFKEYQETERSKRRISPNDTQSIESPSEPKPRKFGEGFLSKIIQKKAAQNQHP